MPILSAVINRAKVYTDFFRVFYETACERCRNYGGTPEPHGHAASLESLLVFINEVHQTKTVDGKLRRTSAYPITVWDAGSGASTAVLCNEPGFDVATFDPDAEYLLYVIKAVERMGLPRPRIGSLEEHAECEACYYDYGTSHRVPMLPIFFSRTNRVFYVDDCHDPVMADLALNQAFDRRWNCVDAALDEHSRWGRLLVRS